MDFESGMQVSWPDDRAAESARARSLRPTNYARNLFHVACAAFALTCAALIRSRGWLLVPPAVFAVYAWSMEGLRRLSPRVNDRLMRFYGPIAHAHERHRVNSATWYGTALVLLVLFTSRPAMMAGVAVLGVADPVAGFVGRNWGKRMLRAGRSLEGSLAFFVAGTGAAAVTLALLGVGSFGVVLGLAAVAALVGAVVEILSTRLDDNFTIPVAVAAVLTVATM
jgi:dolichol kinase